MSTAGEATEVSPSRGLHLTGVPLDRQPPRCSKETEREREREREAEKERGSRGESQTERIHLPVETLQGTGTAAPLCLLKSLCGQSGANKDALISGNSSCLIQLNSCH